MWYIHDSTYVFCSFAFWFTRLVQPWRAVRWGSTAMTATLLSVHTCRCCIRCSVGCNNMAYSEYKCIRTRRGTTTRLCRSPKSRSSDAGFTLDLCNMYVATLWTGVLTTHRCPSNLDIIAPPPHPPPGLISSSTLHENKSVSYGAQLLS